MKRTRTIKDIPASEVDRVVADMAVDNPISVTKKDQGNGLWTVVGEFGDPTTPTEASGEAGARPLAGAPGSPAASASAEALVNHPNIKAMLEVLAFTEGTGNDYGKVVNGLVIRSPFFPDLVGKKNVSVTDLSRHPNILVQVNSRITSTAAGRYQFLKGTWDELGMPDFRPGSQDVAAVKLMKRRRMIEPLLAGDLHTAVFRGAPEWASLPTESGASFYGGQPARTIAEIENTFNKALA